MSGGGVGVASRVSALVLVIVNVAIVALCTCVLLMCVMWCAVSTRTLYATLHTIGLHGLKMLLWHMSASECACVTCACAFVACVSYMGVYGCIARAPLQLFIYSCLMILLLLLECSLFYYYTTNIIQHGVGDGDGDGLLSHSIRLIYKCCDINVTDAVVASVDAIPWSCCQRQEHNNNCTQHTIITQSCSSRVSEWSRTYGGVVYGTLTLCHVVLCVASIVAR